MNKETHLPYCLLKADNCVAVAFTIGLSCPNEFMHICLSLKKAALLSFPSCSVSHKPLLLASAALYCLNRHGSSLVPVVRHIVKFL